MPIDVPVISLSAHLPPNWRQTDTLKVLSESGMRSITMNIFEGYRDGYYPRLSLFIHGR